MEFASKEMTRVKRTYVKPSVTDLTIPCAHADNPDGTCWAGYLPDDPKDGACGTGIAPNSATSCGGGTDPVLQSNCPTGFSPG